MKTNTQSKHIWTRLPGCSPHFQSAIWPEDDGRAIAVVYDDEDGAKGNLIAAAPELLAALERAEKQLAIAYNPSESPILELDRSEAQLSCNEARTAIAKARGL